jgi:O-antigen/teichoic acid export membrane protein
MPRLLKVGSMSGAVGVYVPAMILQKALGLGRVLLFAYLMRDRAAEYGLWGLATMIFAIGAPMATLGANHGLMRYVSLYEARAMLRDFYHRVRWKCLAVILVATAVAILGSEWITRLAIVSPGSGQMSFAHQLHVCWGALANMLAAAIYYDVLAFLIGMRAYRLVSVIELALGVVFTVLATGALLLWPTALSLLTSHLVAQAIAIAAGIFLMHQAIAHQEREAREAALDGQADNIAAISAVGEDITGIAPPLAATDAGGDLIKGSFRKLISFGMVAMIGSLLWMVAQYVSFYMTNRRYGKEDTAVFTAFLQLSQMILLIGNSVYAVVFTHVARRWEGGQKVQAFAALETSYKASAMLLMVLTILLLAAAPVWVKVLPSQFRVGAALLGGLLMYFQTISNLSLLTAIARLYERPIMIGVAALAGGGLNVLLANWWMSSYAYGPAGAAWAAGVGMLVGGLAVTVLYLIIARIRLQWPTYVILASPALLVLPVAWAASAWAAVCLAAVLTTWFFSTHEKRLLVHTARRLLGKLG